uniref:(California timema) hypothetical protein n=1 Tax=Timema californicum TaxID=61474 RepID=A0A7R9PAP5_TIMCA|nr:unnamed protein product [Timema californicum]
MASLVLTDSFEKLPDQIMYPYSEQYDLQKHVFGSCQKSAVSVVLPDVGTTALPETITDALVEDCDYYKVENINIKELTNKDFIEAFVKKGLRLGVQIQVTRCVLRDRLNIIWALGCKAVLALVLHQFLWVVFLIGTHVESRSCPGRLTVLSEDTSIDLDDCAALTPCGHLVLSLSRETYQKLGIEGKPSFFSAKSASSYDYRDNVSKLIRKLAVCENSDNTFVKKGMANDEQFEAIESSIVEVAAEKFEEAWIQCCYMRER